MEANRRRTGGKPEASEKSEANRRHLIRKVELSGGKSEANRRHQKNRRQIGGKEEASEKEDGERLRFNVKLLSAKGGINKNVGKSVGHHITHMEIDLGLSRTAYKFKMVK